MHQALNAAWALIRAATAVAALALAPHFAAAAETTAPLVFFGDRNLPPYEYLEDGINKGFNVDLIEAIGRVLNQPVEIRLINWADAQQRVLAGEGDALTMFGRTPARELLYDFSQPTIGADFALFVRAAEKSNFDPSSLKGVRIGVTAGGLSRPYLQAHHPEAELVLVADNVEGTRMLLGRRIDALAVNAWSERFLLNQLNIGGVAELPAFIRGEPTAMAVRKGDAAVLARIDEALALLKQSGEYERILDRWSGAKVHYVSDETVRAVVVGAVSTSVVLVLLVVALFALRRQKRTLREAAERLQLAIAIADLGAFEVDPQTGACFFSPELRGILGYGPDEPLTLAALDRGVVADDSSGPDAGATFLKGGGENGDTREIRFARPDGDTRWLQVKARAISEDGKGATRGDRLAGIVRDVTKDKLAEERQRLLMREVDHRAKNLLAVVQAVVRLTRAATVEDFTTAVRGRVEALARSHKALARNQWRGAGLRPLVEQELRPYTGENASRASLAGPDVGLAAEAVQSFGMIIHELATNAAKYGALSVKDGAVDVAWEKTERGDLRVTWRERNGPPVRQPSQSGFGSRLIDQAVTHQLGGSSTFAWEAGGLLCVFTIAADRLRQRRQAPAEAKGAAAPSGGLLDGCRILVVEDDAMLASALAQDLRDLGCIPLGPITSVEEALRFAVVEPDLDIAVLDINLHGRMVWPVARALAERGIPYLFATGYGGLATGQPGVPIIEKPYTLDALRSALSGLLQSSKITSGQATPDQTADRE